MTTSARRVVSLLVFAIGLSACDGRSPSGPTTVPPPAPAPTVSAISPSVGSSVRPTAVVISGTGFLAGLSVTIDAMALRVSGVSSTMITAIAPAHSAAGLADIVVTNPGGSGGVLTAAFTYSLDEPFVVTASTNAVAAGGEMSVSWTASAARGGDWITLSKVGGSFDDEDWYGVTNGATSGTQTVVAPTRPGQYEFRYLLDDGFLEAARSSPVTVR